MAIFKNTPPVVTDGLVLYLDAASRQSYISGSTVWNDLSGNNNSGSLINGPTFNSRNGGSIVFDGVNDRCPVENQNFNSTTSSSFTIEIIYKRNSSTPGSAKALYSMGVGGTSNARIFFWFDDDGNGRMAINYYTQTGFDRYIELTRSLDTNFHYAVQVVDKNTLLMTGYFDGVNKGTGTIEISSTSDNIFKIGGNSSCNATIAFVRIYNRALTSTEVLQNYNATKTRFNLT
jgi:hypothetical protein